MVGAACAYYAARAGLTVTVVDRGSVAGGTTGAGEGTLLVSDKAPGPELELALLSNRLWAEAAQEAGSAVEYEAKGGLVAAGTPEALDGLATFADAQRTAGVTADPVPADRLHDLEPLHGEGYVRAVKKFSGDVRRAYRIAELAPELDLLAGADDVLLDEIPTTAELATTADPVALEALRPVAEEIVTAAAAGDLIAYVAADQRFHLGLLALAGNGHLVEVVRDLRRRARLYGLTAPAEQGRLEASAVEHLEILDALLARDTETVGAVMTRHLGHVRGLWAAP